jgi:hypothetical protein
VEVVTEQPFESAADAACKVALHLKDSCHHVVHHTKEKLAQGYMPIGHHEIKLVFRPGVLGADAVVRCFPVVCAAVVSLNNQQLAQELLRIIINGNVTNANRPPA